MFQAIQETGLELHVTFNRAAVMALPAGVTKASGMNYALRKLGLSPHEAVGLGIPKTITRFLTHVNVRPQSPMQYLPSAKQLLWS